ncbi:MAG: mechanosensitive ion channel [Deltaproteobacteria bacterium]|nr:mechanosensitive ion channel [Deltaproteobacteria bacterium]
MVAMPGVRLPPEADSMLKQVLGLVLIGALAWFAASSVYVFRDVVLSKYDITQKDNLKARAIYTQLQVIERIAVFLIIVIAASSMLMTFDKVRQVGVSILASAGIVGIIIGFAAQKSIGTLFAGIQIALTQPIRIDDVVIVEKEWGRVEEITLTYVVIKIWDLRRLIVPITYFIDKSFQDWTRVSADLLGTVFLYADYSLPVEPVREELHRILKASARWDGKVWGLQVTDARERAIEVRALMSAADSSAAWDLRCEVREKLLGFIQAEYPECLPKVRAEVREPEASGPRRAVGNP